MPRTTFENLQTPPRIEIISCFFFIKDMLKIKALLLKDWLFPTWPQSQNLRDREINSLGSGSWIAL